MNGGHHLDANVILRFLLADDPGQSPKAKAVFELAQAGRLTLFISHVTLAEVSWVLLSYYEFERGRLAQTLRELVLHEGVEVDDSDVMLDAFACFGKAHVDFIDCYAAALAKARGCAVVTEDRDFRKFTDVTAHRPEEVIRQFKP
ncbi:MAG: PIN domain-containing protein [Verrucomicrobiota bacterium]